MVSLIFWSINVPAVPDAQRFFTALFGWRYSAPGPSGAVRIDGYHGAFHPSGYMDPEELTLGVSDLPLARERVAAAGGTATPELATPYGASSKFADRGGVRGALAFNATAGVVPLERRRGHGEVVAWNLETSTLDASAQFLEGAFGWQVGPDDSLGGRAVLGDAADEAPAGSLRERRAEHGALTFEVADLDETLRVVRREGGSAGEPFEGIRVDTEAGLAACVRDPQGARFSVWQAGG